MHGVYPPQTRQHKRELVLTSQLLHFRWLFMSGAGEGTFALWLWAVTAERSCFSFSSPSMDGNFPVKEERQVHDFLSRWLRLFSTSCGPITALHNYLDAKSYILHSQAKRYSIWTFSLPITANTGHSTALTRHFILCRTRTYTFLH